VADSKTLPQRNDARRATRMPGNIGAFIILASGDRLRCIVKDFSITGALLIVPSVLGLPDDFELQAVGGPCRCVNVVRRSAGKVAVRFV
jgi:hypothetical protein